MQKRYAICRKDMQYEEKRTDNPENFINSKYHFKNTKLQIQR